MTATGLRGRRAALGEHDAVDPGAVGHAQQSAEVLRVFHAVESQQKASRAGPRRLEEVFDGEKFLRMDERHHALVSGSLGQLRQLLARLLANVEAGLAAEGYQPLQAKIVALASHENLIEAPPAGLDCLLDRVQPIQNFHRG